MFEDQDTLRNLLRRLSAYSLLWISLIFVGVFLMILGLANLFKFSNQPDISCPTVPNRKLEVLLNVDISGAVKKPGIYQLQQNTRFADAVSLAGGFSSEADMQYVAQTLNLARLLKDQEKIYVPFLGEKLSLTVSNKISINRASLEELMLIKGIGEKNSSKSAFCRP